MGSNKHFDDFSEAELLKIALKKDPEGIRKEEDFVPQNNVIKFINDFDLKPGDFPVNVKALYAIYKKVNQNPLIHQSFSAKIKRYFKSTVSQVYLNKDLLKLDNKLILKQRPYRRSARSMKSIKPHMEAFIAAHNLKEGTDKIPLYILFYLYDKWTYKNQTKTPLARPHFSAVLSMYFKQTYLKPKKNDLIQIRFSSLLLQKNVYNYLTQKELEELKSGYVKKIEENKKRKHRKSGTKKEL